MPFGRHRLLLRHKHRLGQGGAREFLERHGVAEQMTLDQVETHLVRRDEIRAGLGPSETRVDFVTSRADDRVA